MSLSRSLLVAAVALSALQTACLGTSNDTEASAIGPLGAETLDGPEGTGTVNGLTARAFHGEKQRLLAATDVQVSSGHFLTYDTIDTEIMDSDGGQEVLRYAIKLALPAKRQIGWPMEDYTAMGEGILRTTSGWMTGGLSDSAKEDLFAGMIALVNPAGNHVPIVLTGFNVHNDYGDHSAFTFPEALWTATYHSDTDTVTFDVWPSPELVDLCSNPITHVLNDRVCGHGYAQCGVTVHGGENDINQQCTQSGVGGNYICNGKPALRTWLLADDVLKVNPICIEAQ